jgi:hypothetical protein
MKNLGRVLVILCTLSAWTADAQQASTASLKDTLLWMHNFVADNGSQYAGQSSDNQNCQVGTSNCQQRHDVSTFDSQGCSATVRWSITLSGEDLGTYTYKVSLKNLDPNSVAWAKDNPFENAVHVDTTNSEKKVMEAFTPPTGKTWSKFLDEPQTWLELVFDNGENAKRFVKAFKHAIQLCGGRHSVF